MTCSDQVAFLQEEMRTVVRKGRDLRLMIIQREKHASACFCLDNVVPTGITTTLDNPVNWMRASSLLHRTQQALLPVAHPNCQRLDPGCLAQLPGHRVADEQHIARQLRKTTHSPVSDPEDGSSHDHHATFSSLTPVRYSPPEPNLPFTGSQPAFC